MRWDYRRNLLYFLYRRQWFDTVGRGHQTIYFRYWHTAVQGRAGDVESASFFIPPFLWRRGWRFFYPQRPVALLALLALLLALLTCFAKLLYLFYRLCFTCFTCFTCCACVARIDHDGVLTSGHSHTQHTHTHTHTHTRSSQMAS